MSLGVVLLLVIFLGLVGSDAIGGMLWTLVLGFIALRVVETKMLGTTKRVCKDQAHALRQQLPLASPETRAEMVLKIEALESGIKPAADASAITTAKALAALATLCNPVVAIAAIVALVWPSRN